MITTDHLKDKSRFPSYESFIVYLANQVNINNHRRVSRFDLYHVIEYLRTNPQVSANTPGQRSLYL